MPIDRDETLRRAEKLLRQGRLDAAIDEYTQLAAAFPADLSIANALGDLLVRGGSVERASLEFLRIADHFFREGFFPKAAALYKKVLKVAPDHVHALGRLAEIAAAQGMARDAKATLQSLVEILERRGEVEAAAGTLRRLADLDPNDIALQQRAADVEARLGDPAGATARLRQLASRLNEVGRHEESLLVWQSVHAIEPSNAETRLLLARAALAQDRLEDAAEFLGSGSPDEATGEWLALRAEVALRRGAADEALAALAGMSEAGASDAEVVEFALMHGRTVDAAFLGAAHVADRLARQGFHAEAVGTLQQFLGHYPRHVPVLAELLERAIDAGLTSVAAASQRGLVEAHLDAGHIEEARLVAEDLVSRAPEDLEHRACLLRVFVAAGDPDPLASLDAHLAVLAGNARWDDFPSPAGDDAAGVSLDGPVGGAGADSQLEPLADESAACDDLGSPRESRTGALDLAVGSDAAWGAGVGDDRSDAADSSPDGVAQDRAGGPPAPAPPQAIAPTSGSAPPRSRDEIDLTPALEALALSPGPPRGADGGVPTSVSGDGPARGAAVAGAPVRPPPVAPWEQDGLIGSGASATALNEAVEEGALGEADHGSDQGDDDVNRQRLSAALSLIEAGLHEDAHPLLEEAARHAATRGAATVALGDVSRLRGQTEAAESYYQRVLGEPHSMAVQRRARYGLGCTLADAGRTPEALVVLLELLADTGEYLDARSRVDALSADSAGG